MNRYKLYKAGVNVNEALRQIGDDKELYEELLKTFKNETRMNELEEALKNKDIKAAFDASHALKGEAGNMGFSRLYEALTLLVDKLRTETLDGTDEIFSEVKIAYNDLMEAIE